MLFKRRLASAAGIVALLAAGAGCSDDGAETAPTAPSSMTVTESATHHQDPPAQTVQPTKTVTAPPTRPVPPTAPRPTKPTGPGSEYDVTCTGGPGEGTICTNPNHGAGDDPYGTGTAAPTTTKPR
ncbi:Uncharacterised protein (plasmid) [Tsukamurella tyrosinosolvens]|uniref:Lipoprotein n=1 Tax=Tsukamurella tyrosinosolvens TaxID=57704 RepID=A0A1H4N852_TSUTY|nr:hypothetical protein [Tsukamurella tyrosinosolvens]KXO97058.1 hypothetical protein AXK58_07315 [Tsukamurella tyrosinosolvens]SEB91413.1 hypothetical protein SAMN04489793_1088 [Tsukamurella tyrosinosolvens]VEI00379.1 Uncharacterised protein [Tsukamurella tyrosinosolvens]